MNTPEEAIQELKHAVTELGLKAAAFGGGILRPIPAMQRQSQELGRLVTRGDYLGLDSAYNYDSVWETCVDLKVAVTFHNSEPGRGSRRSPSSMVFNHIGSMWAGQEPICKALFLGGVTRRFPTLNFAFLEGGAWWGCGLYADILGHWEKRNVKALEYTNPDLLDRKGVLELIDQYGNQKVKSKIEEIRQQLQVTPPSPESIDEFAACRIEKAEDIRDLFVPRFFFGCEADDTRNAWAFNTKVNPLGARIQAILGSDISHWDVQDMSKVVEEAHELVDNGLITDADFRDLAFGNAVRLHAGMNPQFFDGTAVEREVAQLLRSEKE